MKFNDRALVVGKTTGGKSTFARYLCAHFTGARVVVVNVKGKLDVGVPATFDPRAIDWTARVVNFVPTTFRRELFEELYAAIWAHRNVPTVIWLDEAAAVTSASYAPDHLLIVQQQGAEHNVGHVVVAQRCKNIKMELRTEAEELYIFVPPPSQADLQWLAEEIGEVDGEPFSAHELRARMRRLHDEQGDYAFLRWVRATGELDDCAPLDPGWVNATLHTVASTSRGVAATSSQAPADAEEAIELDR